MLVCPLLSEAQDLADLPKLFPSYVEDLSDYSSYPSICFEDSHVDKNGKLWLIPCQIVRRDAQLHLFQFDGYNFKYIREELEQLPVNAVCIGMQNQETLISYASTADSSQLYFYDLLSNQLLTRQSCA